MLERVPEERVAIFVQALQRYRQSIIGGQYDSDAVEQLHVVLLSSNDAENCPARDQAMERLYGRSYGICVTCHQDITEGRLIALPFDAKRCKECQERLEAGAPVRETPKVSPEPQDITPDQLKRAERHRRTAVHSYPDMVF